MGLTPGATSAFKPKAPAAAPKVLQVGAPSFPGKAKVAGVKLAGPDLPLSALSNPALGAMFGLLFGRVANVAPGLRDYLKNVPLRDAAIGASVAMAVQEFLSAGNHPPQEQEGVPAEDPLEPYNPRPTPMSRGWSLQ